jgi:hypothetical protein
MLSRSSRLSFLAALHPRCGMNSSISVLSPCVMRMMICMEDGEHKVTFRGAFGLEDSIIMVVKNGIEMRYSKITDGGAHWLHVIPRNPHCLDLSIDILIRQRNPFHSVLPYGWCEVVFWTHSSSWELSIRTRIGLNDQNLSILTIGGSISNPKYEGIAIDRYDDCEFVSVRRADRRVIKAGSSPSFDVNPDWWYESHSEIAEWRKIIEELHFPSDCGPGYAQAVQAQLMQPLHPSPIPIPIPSLTPSGP